MGVGVEMMGKLIFSAECKSKNFGVSYCYAYFG